MDRRPGVVGRGFIPGNTAAFRKRGFNPCDMLIAPRAIPQGLKAGMYCGLNVRAEALAIGFLADLEFDPNGGWLRSRWFFPTQTRVPPIPRIWGSVMTAGAPSFPRFLRKGWDTATLDRPISTTPQASASSHCRELPYVRAYCSGEDEGRRGEISGNSLNRLPANVTT